MSEHIIEDKRLLFYDILKALLIFFVVFGHTIDTFSTNTTLKAIYLCIYSFHMPLFVFLSGYFAKWDKRKFFGYFLLYFIFTTFQILLKVFVISPESAYTFHKFLTMFIDPLWALWFLPALAIWLLSTKFIKVVKIWHIIFALCLSLCLGFIPEIGTKLTLSRIFYFFPFFLLGKFCKQNNEKFNNIMEKAQKIAYKLSALLILILMFALIVIFVNYLSKSYFYGSYAYTNEFGIVHRTISILVGLLTSSCIFILMPQKINEQSKFIRFVSNIGQKTLSIYLFHILLLILFKEFGAVYFSSHYLISLTTALILSVSIIIITSTKPFVKNVNFILNCFAHTKKDTS